MTDWNKYYKMIVKKFWLVILITLVFVSLSAYISLYKLTPLYAASSQLMIQTSDKGVDNRITYEELLAGQLLVRNYKELIMSRTVTNQVIQNLQLTEVTGLDLAKSMEVELIPDSSMIRLMVRDVRKDAAVDIANEVSSVFIQKASQLLKTDNIILIDKAVASENPVYPRPKLIIAFSFLAGIILSLSLILAQVFFSDKLGSSEEIERRTGLHVVGVIPDMNIR